MPRKKHITSADRQRIVAVATSWLGVPYLLGGDNRDGIDCSHLICQIMREALGIRLVPRADWLYLVEFDIIPKDKLQPGDVVFFRPDPRPLRRLVTHCGLYIGDDQTIHAGKMKVVITPLSRFKSPLIETKDWPTIYRWLEEIKTNP